LPDPVTLAVMVVAAALLFEARKRAGITQRELARRGGVTAPVLSAYERGRRQPGADVLARLVAAAGFDLQLVRTAPRVVDAQRSNERLMDVLGLADAIGRRRDRGPLRFPPLPSA
jgi:transcriptional regulator with XRE-family HTH domain